MIRAYYKILIVFAVMLVGVNSPANAVYQNENVMELQVPMQNNFIMRNRQVNTNVPVSTEFTRYSNNTTSMNIPIISFDRNRKRLFGTSTFGYSDYMAIGSNYSSNVTPTESNSGCNGPKRVGGNVYDPDPYLGVPTPIGDVSIFMLMFASLLYVSLKRIHK